ncbi:MAG: HIT domain-containing protein [Bryobacteraceae bacterium]|jgi:ATP adenylyltransferase
MDYLWTPWRYHYITGAPAEAGVCVFCQAASSADDHQTLVLHRAVHNFVILNRFPYTSGHVMVVPFAHVPSIEDLPEPALSEMMGLARDAVKHQRAIYRPDGWNLGMNLGQSAGAGIAAHAHMHVLPRWTGDTSFITTAGETRVVPEDLETTWEKLSGAFRAG